MAASTALPTRHRPRQAPAPVQLRRNDGETKERLLVYPEGLRGQIRLTINAARAYGGCNAASGAP